MATSICIVVVPVELNSKGVGQSKSAKPGAPMYVVPVTEFDVLATLNKAVVEVPDGAKLCPGVETRVSVATKLFVPKLTVFADPEAWFTTWNLKLDPVEEQKSTLLPAKGIVI